jgi:hypothetical protein
VTNKQHIIDEIKRTATENGGRPLGRLAFLKATGIKETDWRGKYWARWNEAINEAGLSPNSLTVAYSDTHLLGQFVSLVRELGRYPTASEVQLKRRRDPSFPSQTVFERFGGKSQQARKVMEYCSTVPGFEDVAAICNPLLQADSPVDISAAAKDNDIETGYVYLALMQVGREKRYKIGKADIVGTRTRQIAVSLPEELELIHAISTDDAYGIEAYWHRRFADKRRGGEWFALSAEDVRAFKRRKFM